MDSVSSLPIVFPLFWLLLNCPSLTLISVSLLFSSISSSHCVSPHFHFMPPVMAFSLILPNYAYNHERSKFISPDVKKPVLMFVFFGCICHSEWLCQSPHTYLWIKFPLFMNIWIILHLVKTQNIILHSSLDGHLSCSHFISSVKRVTMIMDETVSVDLFLCFSLWCQNLCYTESRKECSKTKFCVPYVPLYPSMCPDSERGHRGLCVVFCL